MNVAASVDVSNMRLIHRALVAVPVLLVAMLIAPSPADSATTANSFHDDDSNIHESSIERIYEHGITNGCGPGRFCPDDPLTRGQMAAFLNRALQLPAATTPSGFTDTAGTFRDDIERLKASGITTGCSRTLYCTVEPVTRGQMAAFLNRALQLPAATTPSGFTDTAGTFRDDIERLKASGITTGCSRTLYCTGRFVTRAEMATFLVRALGLGAGGEGAADVMAIADSAFDSYTSGGHWSFIRSHYDAMRVYVPYWNSRLDEYDEVFAYQVAYGISAASSPPSWVLRTSGGDPTYIPFDCSAGCVRYAADVGNQAFRDNFINWVVDVHDLGYQGLMLDDVNFAWRFSDRWGNDIAPIDPRTGQPLTLGNWQRYFAEFLEQIRAAVPDMEIMHNVIWYADTPDFDNSYIDRQIAAADYLQLERGANDAGLVRGSGPFGMRTFLSFIDRAHALGTNVVLVDQHATGTGGLWYNLAATLLINDGNDMVSTQQHKYITPGNYWSGFDTDLGDALGPRRIDNGVIRRDFTGGVVLLNEPKAPTQTITFTAPMRKADGSLVRSVTLGSREAAVLTTP